MTGSNKSRVILGFMLATAFLSMWISNTATSIMILPVGLAIISQLKDDPNTKENENEVCYNSYRSKYFKSFQFHDFKFN